MKMIPRFSPLVILAVTLVASSVLPDATADERRRPHTHYYTYDERGRKVEVVRERLDSDRRDYRRRYEHSGYRERYDSRRESEQERRRRGHDYNREQALRLFGELLRR